MQRASSSREALPKSLRVFQPVETLRKIRSLQIIELPYAADIDPVRNNGHPAVAGKQVRGAFQNVTNAGRAGEVEGHAAVRIGGNAGDAGRQHDGQCRHAASDRARGIGDDQPIISGTIGGSPGQHQAGGSCTGNAGTIGEVDVIF